MNKTVKVLAYTAGALVGLVAVYLAAGYGLQYVPVNNDDNFTRGDVDIYILSNGVHTDLVVPLRNPQMDWSQMLPIANTPAQDAGAQFVGIGWGDKGFYLDTPTWADLKFSTAFKAAFWLSSSAMHTTFYRRMEEGEKCVKIRMSHDEYDRLVRYIRAKFQYDAAGKPIWISGHSYGEHDSFYEAHGVYNLFYSCNTWTNNGLKQAGQRASLWALLDDGIFYQYRH